MVGKFAIREGELQRGGSRNGQYVDGNNIPLREVREIKKAIAIVRSDPLTNTFNFSSFINLNGAVQH